MAGIAEGAGEGLKPFDGDVVLLAWGGVGGAFFHAGDFADDGGPGGLHVGGADAHAFADGVLAGPGLLGELLIHDDDELGVGLVVGFGEETSAEEGNAHGAEDVSLDLDGGGEIDGAGLGRDVAFRDEGAVALVAVGGQEGGEAGGFDAGQRAEAAEEILIELVDGGLRCVLLVGQAVVGDEGVVGVVAEAGLAHFLKAAQQEAGGGKKDEGDGDLGDDEAGAEARVSGAGGAGASAFFEGVVEAGAHGGEGGGDSADDAGDDAEGEGEDSDLPVERDVGDEGEVFGEAADADFEGDGGEDESDDAAGDAEDEAFEKRLAEEGGAAGAEGEADGHFAAAADGADEEKSGEVGAGDEQDDGDGEEEGADEGTGLGDDVLMEAADDGADVQAGHEGGVAAHDFLGDAIGVVTGFGGGDAGLEAADHLVAPVGLAPPPLSSSGRRLRGIQSSMRMAWPAMRGNSKLRGMTPVTM